MFSVPTGSPSVFFGIGSISARRTTEKEKKAKKEKKAMQTKAKKKKKKKTTTTTATKNKSIGALFKDGSLSPWIRESMRSYR